MPARRLRAADYDEISGMESPHCLYRDGTVEGGEPAVVPNGQAEQVGICDFLMAADHRPVKQRLIEERHGVRPEMMVGSSASVYQPTGHLRRGVLPW